MFSNIRALRLEEEGEEEEEEAGEEEDGEEEDGDEEEAEAVAVQRWRPALKTRWKPPPGRPRPRDNIIHSVDVAHRYTQRERRKAKEEEERKV